MKRGILTQIILVNSPSQKGFDMSGNIKLTLTFTDIVLCKALISKLCLLFALSSMAFRKTDNHSSLSSGVLKCKIIKISVLHCLTV